jgi:hypothetical protein
MRIFGIPAPGGPPVPSQPRVGRERLRVKAGKKGQMRRFKMQRRREGGAGEIALAIRSLRLERAYDDGGHEYERRGDHGQMQRSGKCQHLVIPSPVPQLTMESNAGSRHGEAKFLL